MARQRETPSNTDNVIDSRDIVDEIDSGNLSEEDQEIFEALAEEVKGSPDWEYGETLIRDSYFEDYARELAEDIGAISGDEKWPLNHIDWESAADELRQDYFSVDFDGVDYWIRS